MSSPAPRCALMYPIPPFELAATTCAREKPDEQDPVVQQHQGHHPRMRLVVFAFSVTFSDRGDCLGTRISCRHSVCARTHRELHSRLAMPVLASSLGTDRPTLAPQARKSPAHWLVQGAWRPQQTSHPQ